MLLHTTCHMEQGIRDDISTSVALRVKAICLSAYSTIIYYPVRVQCTLSTHSAKQLLRVHMLVKDPRDIYRQQIIY